MKFAKLVTVAAAALLLSACAGTVSKPTALSAMSSEQSSAIRIASITGDADSKVVITDSEITDITQKVRGYINQNDPSIMVDPSTGDALTMKIHFTKFDRGNRFARAMLIGLGQIHIDAVVTLEKADGSVAGKYNVKKTFALGGIVGAATGIQDVEEGFAKSVAEIVKKKAG